MTTPADSSFNHHSTDRKLSAILFADIQGYTAMMQADEDKALSRLQRYQEVLDKNVRKFNGEIVKNYGDGSLCLFGSTLNALKCSRAVQEELKIGPEVPLRIGLHLGDVTYRDGDVYGNDINITSRIESIGVAGSVLMSADFWNKLKNKTGFKVTSMGSFQFKNVDEKMEVFALANEGLIVPEKSEMKGKLANTSAYGKRNIWIISIVGLLLLVVAGYIATGKGNNDDTKISSQNLQKRVTILSFQNQTGNPEYDSYGIMFSDWITRGLMNLDNANIVAASNIQDQIAQAKLGVSANPQFANSTGIDLIIEGRYYFAEDQIIALANLVDVATGIIIKSFQLQDKRTATMTLLDDLTQEIINYWAVKDNVQFSGNPPVYEAYKEYLEGQRMYGENAREAAERFESAFLIDSTFFPPLFRLYGLNKNMADFEKTQEIIEYLDSKKDVFTKFERFTYDALKAHDDKNYLLAAQLFSKLTDLDSSDYISNRSSAYTYFLSNRPSEAIKVLNSFDQRLLKDGGANFNWRSDLEAIANFNLGNYSRVIEIAENDSFPKMSAILAVNHLQSLIHLKNFDALEQQYKKYVEKGVYAPVGTRINADNLLMIICSELFISDDIDILKEYVDKLILWMAENTRQKFPQHLPDLYNSRPFRNEEIEGYIHFYQDDYLKALSTWQSEKIPDTNWPDVIERSSRLGVCYAKLNNPQKAREQIKKIDSIQNDHIFLALTKQYYKSRIYTALGEIDNAVQEISNSLDNGMILMRPYILKTDPFLKNLNGYGPFEEVVKPKG